MKYWLVFICILGISKTNAQYMFSGHVDENRWQNTVYLSVIDDYRKLSGVYSEQIISKATTDSLGVFKFTGNQLENKHRLYRIHVDNCSDDQQASNHFGGHCPDSKEVIFIAKNTDTISFPFSFDNQMFCDIKSNNPKATALIKIDSLKEQMRFAYSDIRSDASRKLNNKKWFKELQEYSKNLNEPLAELYAFSFLSDRSSEFHDYYLSDLQDNSYYKNLKGRLETTYPNVSYTQQFITDIEADSYRVSKPAYQFPWLYVALFALAISLLFNVFFAKKLKSKKNKSVSNLKSSLTKQEQAILNNILEGKTNKDIAETLFVSPSTVKTHINNIYKKLQVSSREEAISLFKN